MKEGQKTAPPAAARQDDLSIDIALRPARWDEYIGQEQTKRNLRILIDAAKKRGESADHILFAGPAGLGKTTLACLVAKELEAPITTTSGPALEKLGDMAAVLTNLEPHAVLFIDEAHRVNRLVEEVLYPAMEARKLHLMVGKGPSARTLTLDLPPFTLVAATTRENLLSQPLRSRFGATFRLNFYNQSDIRQIIMRAASILGVEIDSRGIDIIAKASRGTPRIANRLLRRARDFAEVNGVGVIDQEAAGEVLGLLEIDAVGLEPNDRKLLEIIIKKFNGGPVGSQTLAAAMNEERGVIEDIYEPYLMTLGFLKRTPAGRVAMSAAYDHLGIQRRSELL